MTKRPALSTIKKAVKTGILLLVNFVLILIFLWITTWGILLGYLGLIIILTGVILWMRKRVRLMYFSWGLLFLTILFLFNPSLTKYYSKTNAYIEKIDNGKGLNTTEKISIYGLNIFMCLAAYPLYPEVAKESLYLMFKSEKKIREFESGFFMNSPKIKRAFQNNQTRVDWSASNYVMGHQESRYSLALNPCELTRVESARFTEFSVAVYVNYSNKTEAVLMRTPFKISVEEGLFYYLQEEKWLHPYTAVWKTRVYK